MKTTPHPMPAPAGAHIPATTSLLSLGYALRVATCDMLWRSQCLGEADLSALLAFQLEELDESYQRLGWQTRLAADGDRPAPVVHYSLASTGEFVFRGTPVIQLSDLIHLHEAMIIRLHQDAGLAGVRDQDTANLMARLVGRHERDAWMLRSQRWNLVLAAA